MTVLSLGQMMRIFLSISPVITNAFSRSTSLPTWSDLERRLPSSVHPADPAVYHSVRDNDGLDVTDAAVDLEGKTVLYRDSNGWCPYSQRVWLALEMKRADFVSVLVDVDVDEYSAGTRLPRVRWSDGTTSEAGEVYAILERIEKEHPHPPAFYPDVSVSVGIVRDSIERRFDGIMPRNTRASSLAPYIFRTDEAGAGQIVPKFK